MKERIAIYPGSFDPVTNGHLDIILRGLGIFDRLIVGIAKNTSKQTLFSTEERKGMVEKVFEKESRIEVDSFKGMTVEYARKKGACALLRGLRAVADFEFELQMANMNRKLSGDIETVFMMTSEKSFFVSSRSVKEVAQFGGDISDLVPKSIASMVYDKFR